MSPPGALLAYSADVDRHADMIGVSSQSVLATTRYRGALDHQVGISQTRSDLDDTLGRARPTRGRFRSAGLARPKLGGFRPNSGRFFNLCGAGVQNMWRFRPNAGLPRPTPGQFRPKACLRNATRAPAAPSGPPQKVWVRSDEGSELVEVLTTRSRKGSEEAAPRRKHASMAPRRC